MGWLKDKLRPIKRTLIRIKNNAIYLVKYDFAEVELERTYRLTDKIIEDCIYEFDETKAELKTLNILDEYESVQRILEVPKSFCRLGDGEIKLIQGIDQAYQKYEPELAQKLDAILASERDDIYVGINRAYFHSPINCSEENRRFYRINSCVYRRFFIQHCNPNREYLDAGFLTAYYRFNDNYDFEKHYLNMKALFKGRKIVLVCGEGIDKKLKFDVFEYADEKIVINGPARNAFASYSDIMKEIIDTVDTEYVICLILGMTAKIMVPELTDLGYIAWDVGHLAQDYDVYMRGLKKTKKNIDSFWAPD